MKNMYLDVDSLFTSIPLGETIDFILMKFTFERS